MSVTISRFEKLQQKRLQRERQNRLRNKLLRLVLLLIVFVILAAVLILAYLPKAMRRQSRAVTPLFSITGLNRPLAVSTDERDYLYVSDTGNGRLMVYDSAGKYVRQIKGAGTRDRFNDLFGSRVDETDGRLYLADWGRRVVSIFTAGGRLVRRFPSHPLDTKIYGALGFSPFGLDIFGGKLYIASNDGIYVFSKNGVLMKKIGVRGDKVGQFNYPTAVAVDKKDGSIYVADQLNRRVVAMTAKGTVKWALGRQDKQANIISLFGLPRGIAIDRDGKIFITDTFHHRIVVVNPEGKLISVIGKKGADAGEFRFPEGLVFNRANVMYLADRENNRIQVLKINRLPRPSKQMLNIYRRSLLKKAR